VGFHGQLIDIGEITIPAHVGLQTRNGMTSVNFAYEIAWAILRQSRTPLYTACIGIEDTAWKRGNVDLSADANYSRFAFPRERIAAIAELKAVQEGVFAPNDIRGVAPARDCGNCGFRSEGSGMWMRAVQRCPHCYLLGQPSRLEPVEDRDPLMYTCRNCSRRWEHKIPQLKCQRCGFQQYAPYNTALVVARRMLLQVSAQNKPISNNT
jgi:hypothetical protein